ncbi:protein VASCULAR ASSOCIATED DEATH 1, chloroplastic-like [Zingiber officinale]|uniref:protein VASCULAR ASSOCIATED DEATH 1, chloroplastic-like n=1 Tax=Zingiber officinale TaxID=94328 RepID=UPI001C4CF2D8|nr:protein VASCULAR ASSOCIATED DEATH 1, chloroplastic-like [Zingiber officinale]
MVASASPMGNSGSNRSSPSSSPVAEALGAEDSSGHSSAAESAEFYDRRVGDILTQVLSSRSEEYRWLFRLPSEEVLIQDFNCAFQENILLQGHMYLFTHYICFYSNIFGFETKKMISLHEVTAIHKAKTVAIFPNAIEIVAGGTKYFFGSFLSRDEAYRLITDSWAQHGGDIKTMDTRSEGRNQGNAILFENVQECKPLADDSSSSNRFQDTNAREELNALPNGKVDRDITVKPPEIKEKECEQNFNQSSLETPLIWTIEDIDAPTVPEHFTFIAESKFPLLVKDFFNLFVSDQALGFLKDFHTRCGDKDFQCTSWRRHELFGYIRNVSLVHPVKVYLGPKFGNCQEVQKYRVYRNSHLVIETSQHIKDVPYGDYFEVQGMWDVVQDSGGEKNCTVKIYSNVAFSKKTMFKGKIEQSTREECREVYATWMSMAHDIVKQKEQNVPQPGGNLELSNCVVPHKGIEFERPPESIENPTSTSKILLYNIHEISNKPGICNTVDKQSNKYSLLMSVLHESWETLLLYMRRRSLLPLVLAIAFIVFILLQLNMILLLTRVPEVHVVTHGYYNSEAIAYNVENVEWLEKRFNYLKEEMAMMETRLERMHHEYALLKSHLGSLEQMKAKSRRR